VPVAAVPSDEVDPPSFVASSARRLEFTNNS